MEIFAPHLLSLLIGILRKKVTRVMKEEEGKSR